MSSESQVRLIALLEPLLDSMGFELADLELQSGRRSSLLRLFIDRAAGVGIDDCERVSREVSAALDVHDPIASSYTLEVSSPGLDRVLRRAEHFVRFVGKRVWVELKQPRGGRQRYTGRLERATDVEVELNVDGAAVSIAFSEIGKARLAPEWPQGGRKRKSR